MVMMAWCDPSLAGERRFLGSSSETVSSAVAELAGPALSQSFFWLYQWVSSFFFFSFLADGCTNVSMGMVAEMT